MFSEVLGVISGKVQGVGYLVEELHEGSVLASVEGVSVEWRTPMKRYDDFSVLV
jgi:acylphosphatase